MTALLLLPTLHNHLLLTPLLKRPLRPTSKPIQTPLPPLTIHLLNRRHRQPSRPLIKRPPPKRLRRTRIMAQIHHRHAPKPILRLCRILITLEPILSARGLTLILRTRIVDHDDDGRRADVGADAAVGVGVASIGEPPAGAALAGQACGVPVCADGCLVGVWGAEETAGAVAGAGGGAAGTVTCYCGLICASSSAAGWWRCGIGGMGERGSEGGEEVEGEDEADRAWVDHDYFFG